MEERTLCRKTMRESPRNKKSPYNLGRFFIWAAVDCLDLFALNVSSCFAFCANRTTKQKHFALCSQVARTSTEVLTIKTRKIKEMITNVIISFMVGVRRLELLTLSL